MVPNEETSTIIFACEQDALAVAFRDYSEVQKMLLST
jgi:hypothetical protein